ncbi:ribosome biogenesis protein NOP53 [Diabrotica virgifera virgifera]|uniref:Ribosome biogenesis protein NOP53 n=1 Tax=Diabrotica virgifera virgifera TaxID=50390 RepID=A0ABM5IPK1_DIAVI|nr:ribosome biogenesis protein NOP53 [Diabrotica virgifera virgifera]
MAISSSIKKKRVSKKLKSSWRKHVNINEVEEFLEEQRLEERLGPSLELVPDSELFKVDSKPSTELLSSRERRKLKAAKPLKCFSALQPHTNVPDPISRRNRVRTKEERKSRLVTLKEQRNEAKGIVKRKSLQAAENRKLDDLKRKSKPKRGDVSSDLWQDSDKQATSEEWVDKNAKKHNLRGVGVAVKKTRSRKLATNIPAIEPPHPGMSYNPSYADHQDLLQKVAEKEQKLIKEENHLRRVTSGMFSKVTESKRDEDWLISMSEGLPSKSNIVSDNEEGSDTEFKSINPPVKNVKKTLKQKRKHKEHLELEKARKAVKLEKKKVTDIHNLRKVVKHIDSVKEKQNKLREIRKKNRTLNKKPTVLNANKFEEPDLEFNMGQDIAGNLKDLKTEGNILVDRFKSMQKRNILAPTKRQSHKKAKVKKYTKPGHKDTDWKKSVARSLS